MHSLAFLQSPISYCFNVDLDLVDVDDVASPTVKLSDAKCHASLLFTCLLENSVYFGVNEITSFQKLVGNLDKMTVVNLGRQHHRSLNFYFKNSLYLFEAISYYFMPSVLLKLAAHILKLVLLMFSYSLNNATTLRHFSY